MPIIDGLIGSPESVFNLLKKYLLDLNISQVDNIVFVADGAPWIWKRINELLESITLPSNTKVYQVLDSTPVDTLKAGEINLEAGKGMEAKYKYDPSAAGTMTTTGRSKVGELMENVQDFAEQKATEYASKWVSNKIDEKSYGAGDDYSTSIGFNPWEEEGVGITAQNFFTQGDSYTTSLATFYDQASRAFDNTGLNTQALANIGR